MVIVQSSVFRSDGIDKAAECLVEGIRPLEIGEVADAGEFDVFGR
jgi:hypothetical protein